jgi:tetratricopeptide (TPR) repeat protein
MKLAYEIGKIVLFQECGDILEQQKQYSEAAEFHLQALDFERAAFIYTKHIVRNDPSRIKEASLVLAKVSNDQLNLAFAALCMTAGKYTEAMSAYSRANDHEKVPQLMQ